MVLSHAMPWAQLLNDRGGLFYSHPTEVMGEAFFCNGVGCVDRVDRADCRPIFLAERAVQGVRRTTSVGLFPLSPNSPGRAMC